MAQKIAELDPAQEGNLHFAQQVAVSGRRGADSMVSTIRIEPKLEDRQLEDLFADDEARIALRGFERRIALSRFLSGKEAPRDNSTERMHAATVKRRERRHISSALFLDTIEDIRPDSFLHSHHTDTDVPPQSPPEKIKEPDNKPTLRWLTPLATRLQNVGKLFKKSELRDKDSFSHQHEQKHTLDLQQTNGYESDGDCWPSPIEKAVGNNVKKKKRRKFFRRPHLHLKRKLLSSLLFFPRALIQDESRRAKLRVYPNSVLWTSIPTPSTPISCCVHCGCLEELHYFAHDELPRNRLNNHRRKSSKECPFTPNLRIIDSSDEEEILPFARVNIDNAGEDCTPEGYLGNSLIAAVFAHHLHEGWFSTEGLKASPPTNLLVRRYTKRHQRETFKERKRRLRKNDLWIVKESESISE